MPDLPPILTPDDLHTWIKDNLHLHVPRNRVCPHHQAPFDYLTRAFFEPSMDQIVWAPRGGGKTSLAAVATLLDLLYKPEIAIRILGGSLDQSLRMWEYLLSYFNQSDFKDQLANPNSTARRVTLNNHSVAAVLTQSQRSVRGVRVQKLRCDEIELFDPRIWSAAQLTTRSKTIEGTTVRGSIEALSTMHEPYGLMNKLVDQCVDSPDRIVKWCLLDVLQKCEPERQCPSCPLWDDCKGIAKTHCDGFFSIDDAILMKHRVSSSTWQSEMLCLRPSHENAVFPMLDLKTHVVENPPFALDDACQWWLAIDFGFRAPLVCLWIILRNRQVHVIDEHVKPQTTFASHLESIRQKPWGFVRQVACDPAGASQNDQTAQSNIDLLIASGYRVLRRKSRIIDGLELIRAALQSASGQSSLSIHPRCKNLIRSMQCYHYKADISELPHKDGEHDHAVDALRYFFVNATTDTQIRVKRY